MNELNTHLINQTIKQYKKAIFNDLHSSFRVWVHETNFYLTEIVQWQENIIHFFAPIAKGEFVRFDTGKQLDVQFPASSGLYSTKVQIIAEYLENGNIYYDAKILSPIHRQQLRAYFRLDTLLDLKYTILDSVTPAVAIHEQPTLTGTSVNISAGGLCMLSTHPLHVTNQLYIYLEFLEHQIELIGEVIMSSTANEFGKYTHRLQFIHLAPPTQDLLAKLIFEKQRLERASLL